MFAGQRMSEGRGGFVDLTGEGAVTGAGGAGRGEGEASTSMMEGGARGREPDARGVADACERAAEATEATGLDGGRAPGAGAEGAREADETGAMGREPDTPRSVFVYRQHCVSYLWLRKRLYSQAVR